MSKKIGFKCFCYFLILLFAVLFMLPLYIMVTTSFKTPDQIFIKPPQWIPSPFNFTYYGNYFTNATFWTYFQNTAFITFANIFLAVLVNPIIAFSFAKLRWPGRNLCFMLMMATMMLPEQVKIIPLFERFMAFGWLNTYMPLIILSCFGNPTFVFLLRQFILGIPNSIYDSARIDGCNNYRLFFSMTLPLLKAPIATIVIFEFMNIWNDFFKPLIFINSNARKTLALGLMDLIANNAAGSLNWGNAMTAAVMSLIPCVILFFAMQRFFIEGLTKYNINK